MATNQEINLIPVDHESFTANLIENLRVLLPETFQDFLESNRARVLVDAIAGEQALLAIFVNANLLQQFLPLCTTRQAAFLLGQLVNYNLAGAVPSFVSLTFSLAGTHPFDIVIPAFTQVQAPGNPPIIFETREDVTLVTGNLSVSVEAIQGQTITETVGTTSLANTPNQQYVSTKQPIFDTITLIIQNITWTKVENIFDLEVGQRGYTAKPNQDGFALFTFGDGNFGAIPPAGFPITVTYRIGGGSNTNVNSKTITEILSTIMDTNSNIVSLSVTNLAAASGGTDQESVDQARINIPRSVRSMDRFVSREDFQTLPALQASSNGSVFKSNAAVKYTWADHIITLFILGAPPFDSEIPTIPSQILMDDVKQFVEDRTLPTIRINVEAATLLPINITGTVFYLPNFRTDTIVAGISAALDALFDPTIRNIGTGFRLSDLYAALDNVVGVDYVDIQIPVGNINATSSQFIIRGTVQFTYVRQTR